MKKSARSEIPALHHPLIAAPSKSDHEIGLVVFPFHFLALAIHEMRVAESPLNFNAGPFRFHFGRLPKKPRYLGLGQAGMHVLLGYRLRAAFCRRNTTGKRECSNDEGNGGKGLHAADVVPHHSAGERKLFPLEGLAERRWNWLLFLEHLIQKGSRKAAGAASTPIERKPLTQGYASVLVSAYTMTPTSSSFWRRHLVKMSVAGMAGLGFAVALWLVTSQTPPATSGTEPAAKPEAASAAVPGSGRPDGGWQAELRAARARAAEGEAKAQEMQQRLMTAQTEQKASPPGAEWLRDPKMVQVLKDEAKSAATRSASALLEAGLAQKLGLDGEQTDRLKQLLTERGAIVWEKMFLPMTIGDLDGPGKAAAGNVAKQELERNSGEIRSLVGQQGFETYQWFEKTQPDREAMKQFAPQFAQAGQGLTGDQQGQLLAAMMEERARFHFQHELGDPMQLDFEHWDDNFTEDKLNTHFQEMDQLNERIAERVQTVLSAEQLALLRELETKQLQRAKFTVKSTMAMMGRKR